jgi:hypothetical protein
MPFCSNCGTSVKPTDRFCNECGATLQTIQQKVPETQSMPVEKPPTVLDGFIQPGLPVKVYTIFFMKDRLVATKTGSWTTYAAGTMSTAMGGSGSSRAQGYAIGSIMDHFSSNSRGDKAAKLAGYSPDEMAAADKANFQVPYGFVSSVEIKGPNFANELHIKIKAGKEHKFRIDNQSKDSIRYIINVFQEFLPGKITLK